MNKSILKTLVSKKKWEEEKDNFSKDILKKFRPN